MDPITLLLLGGFVVVAIVVTLVMLNRSWGNFPNRTGPPSWAEQLSQDPVPTARGDSVFSFQEQVEQADEADMGFKSARSEAPGLVPISHPLIRRAAEDALARGAPQARYIVQQGDQLYFSFEQIPDPVQRQAAYDLMRRFEAGEDVDMRDMLSLIRDMFMH